MVSPSRIGAARRPLLSSCAVAAALAATGQSAPVGAQAFQGNPTIAAGNVNIDRSTPGIDTITVNSATAIIDWTATAPPSADGSINFLAGGSQANFVNNSDVFAGDYTILNRIMPGVAGPIRFDGTVTSRLDRGNGFGFGGNVWFYSPGGIVVGATAVFDVGGLLLSANNILTDNDTRLFGDAGEIRFRGVAGSRSAIVAEEGASITARAAASGAYVALVAPRIDQRGLVSVDGSAGYLAAESADVLINNGLFSFSVIAGSTVNGIAGDEVTLRHTGQTVGIGAGAGTPRGVFMVAMPKNDAITLLVAGGSIAGYASSASVQNDVVVLSAGADISSTPDGFGGFTVTESLGPAAGVGADVQISGAGFYSNTLAIATRDVIARGSNGLAFDGDATLKAGRLASLGAVGGQQIDVGGDLALTFTAFGATSAITAGSVELFAEGGSTIAIGGQALLDASALATTGDATGGLARARVVGSTLTVDGDLALYADASGGAGVTGPGGRALAGVADLAIGGGSTVSIGQSLFGGVTISAVAEGGSGAPGGAGKGGSATLSVNQSSLDISPSGLGVRILAQGFGGAGRDASASLTAGDGGNGDGGLATLTVAGASTVTTSSLFLNVGSGGGGGGEVGYGATGNGGIGGAGIGGGVARATFSGGTISSPFIGIGADAFGGNGGEVGYGATGNGGAGGDAIAGLAEMLVNGATLSGVSSVFIGASANSSFGSNGGDGAIGGIGGDGDAGAARLTLTSGALSTAQLGVFADSNGGEGGSGAGVSAAGGGAGGGITGGPTPATAELLVRGGAFSTGFATISARANSGSVSSGPAGAGGRAGAARLEVVNGGTAAFGSTVTLDATVGFRSETSSGADAFGGRAEAILSAPGVVTIGGALRILADAYSGTDVNGVEGDATGGIATLALNGTSLALGTAGLTLSASGVTGNGFLSNVTGGVGAGGSATLSVINAAFSIAQDLDLDAFGVGGDGDAAGDGRGGVAQVALDGGSITIGSAAAGPRALHLNVDGAGGTAFNGGAGGDGFGGGALVRAANGTIDAATLVIDAHATGGDGGSDVNGGGGGAATGGSATVDAGVLGTLSFALLDLDSSATGGAGGFETGYGVGGIGGDGGSAGGGLVALSASGGQFQITSYALNALGAGGDGASASIGGSGGFGAGGTLQVSATSGSLSFPALGGDVSGAGGFAGAGSAGAGGNGGGARGGTVSINAAGATGLVQIGDIDVQLDARAQDGGSGASGAQGRAGGAGGGATGGTLLISANLGQVVITGDPEVGLLANLEAIGGDGGTGGNSSGAGNSGGAGGAGGDAIGGTMRVLVTGGSVSLPRTAAFLNAEGGNAGAGGAGATTGANGVLGRGSGGSLLIDIADNGPTAGTVDIGALTIEATGSFSGRLIADGGGWIALADRGLLPAGGLDIASLTATVGGVRTDTLLAFDLFSTNRVVTIAGAATIKTDGPVAFHAQGSGGLAVNGAIDVAAVGPITVSHDLQTAPPSNTIAATTMRLASLTSVDAAPTSVLRANGFLQLSTVPAAGSALLALPVAGRTIRAGTLIGAGDVLVDGLDDVVIGAATAGGVLIAASPNSLTVGSARSTGNMLLDGVVSINVGSAIGGRDVEITTDLRGTDTSLTTPRSITIGSAQAGDDLVVAGFGAVSAGSLTTTGAGADGTPGLRGTFPDQPGATVRVISEKGAQISAIDAAGGVSVRNIAEVRNGVQISDGSGGITITDVAAGGAVSLNSPLSAISIQTIDAGGAASITSTSAAVAVLSDIAASGPVTAAGTSITLNALGDLNVATATAIDANSIRAAGDLSVNGAVTGRTITLASSDIAVGATATIGGANTASLTFTNSGAATTFLGGADDASGYSLNNAEFARAFASDIFIKAAAPNTQTGGAPGVFIDRLDIAGSAATAPNLIGTDASLTITTDGDARVIGAVRIVSAGANDLLAITANNRIDVVTPGGSIAATDPQGALAGRIALAADTIAVASAQAAADIAALATVDERDSRLGRNDGAEKPEGYLQANTLSFRVGDALYIQNSGGVGQTPNDRRGFTFGSGGLGIATVSDGAAVIVINGRHAGPSGFVTGQDVVPLLTLTGAASQQIASFDPRSTVNSCLIIGVSCGAETPPVEPVQDVIERIDEIGREIDGSETVQALNVPMIQLADFNGLSFAPLIDEPVTGAGNDGLYGEAFTGSGNDALVEGKPCASDQGADCK